MKASELLRRYAAGERDFRGVNLRGQSFKGQDLSGADFSGADIRSADFSGATLCGVNFSGATAGLQKRWLAGLLGFLSLLSILLGLVSGIASIIISSEFAPGFTGHTGLALVVVAFAVILVIVNARYGFPSFLGATATVLSITSVGAISFAFFWTGISAVALTLSVLGGIAVLVTTSAIVSAATGVSTSRAALWTGMLSLVAAVIGGIIGLDIGGTIELERARSVQETIIIAWFGNVVTIIIGAFNGCYVATEALRKEEKFPLFRPLIVAFAAIGGTRFRKANLTNTTFAQATLRSTDLRVAKLTLANLHQTKKLDRARLGGTLLLNAKVRELAVTHRGKGQSYKGLDLSGIHLAGADLSDADLTEADLSSATLEGAWLERVNLTRSQALGTNFHQAQLTGACLEAWNIDSTTQLEGAICEYAYLLNGQRERRPNSGNFAPGEFAKLFEKVLDTIDLIFRNGVDWKAFVTSFKQVQVENEGVELSIQSIENKGDGVVVVRVNAPPETDKEKIHSDFNRNYEAELAALKAEYQAQLQAKDEQIITIYREKSADMMEITKLLASRPITHAETHINQVEAMTQNPGGISQTVTSSPGSNINAFQGDHNQVTQTQGAQAQPSQEEVIEMLAQIKSLIEAAALPGEVKVEANAHLKTAQKAAAQEKPKKEIALATLESMAETLEEASKTVEVGKTLWEQVKPILVKVAGWLGAAVGSSLLG